MVVWSKVLPLTASCLSTLSGGCQFLLLTPVIYTNYNCNVAENVTVPKNLYSRVDMWLSLGIVQKKGR